MRLVPTSHQPKLRVVCPQADDKFSCYSSGPPILRNLRLSLEAAPIMIPVLGGTPAKLAIVPPRPLGVARLGMAMRHFARVGGDDVARVLGLPGGSADVAPPLLPGGEIGRRHGVGFPRSSARAPRQDGNGLSRLAMTSSSSAAGCRSQRRDSPRSRRWAAARGGSVHLSLPLSARGPRWAPGTLWLAR